MSDIDDINAAIDRVETEINQVNEQIRRVESSIEDTEAKALADDDKQFWSRKLERLHEEKMSLRRKEEQLREEKMSLRRKEELLREERITVRKSIDEEMKLRGKLFSVCVLLHFEQSRLLFGYMYV